MAEPSMNRFGGAREDPPCPRCGSSAGDPIECRTCGEGFCHKCATEVEQALETCWRHQDEATMDLFHERAGRPPGRTMDDRESGEKVA